MGFQAKVIEMYKSKGYIVLNLMRVSNNGFPDLQCLKNGRSVFIECKAVGDTLKPLQKYRIRELIKHGFEAFCLHEKKGVTYPPQACRSLEEFKKIIEKHPL